MPATSHSGAPSIRVQIEGGTFKITRIDPRIEMLVTERGLILRDEATDRRYQINVVLGESSTPDVFEVVEIPAGLRFETGRFEIARPDQTAVEVMLAGEETAQESPRSASSDETCVFFGCGTTGSPGTIDQVTLTGEVIGSVATIDPANGLVRCGDALYVANATPRVGGGQTLVIRGDGSLGNLPLNDDFPAPLAIAVDPKTQDLVIADNELNTVSRVRRQDQGEVDVLFHAPLDADHKHYPSMSVAVVNDGYVAFSASDPKGLYRLPLASASTLPESLLEEDAEVAADPTSDRWVALLRGKLVVFEGAKKQKSIRCPAGAMFAQYRVMAFAPNGELLIALNTGKGTEIHSVNLDSGDFTPKFVWSGGTIQSMAVGPRMDWQK
jgi:hypothetical protein